MTNGGRVSLLGTHAVPATIDLSQEVIFKGIRIYGITGRRLLDTWYRTTCAARGRPRHLTPIITHRLPLSDYAKAFDLVAAGHAGKIVLLPQEELSTMKTTAADAPSAYLQAELDDLRAKNLYRPLRR